MFEKIEFLCGATDFEKAQGGYSSAQKFLFLKDGKKYFLKIGNFQVRENLEELFSRAEIPHPKVVESGAVDENLNYIIEEFCEGVPLKNRLDNFDEKFVYEFGFLVGEKYRKLKKQFPDRPVDDEAYAKYMKQVDANLEKLALAAKANERKLSKKQMAFLEYITQFLKEERALVKNSVMAFAHTDVKPSNFLVDGRNLSVIDFEHTDYKELSLSLLWSVCRADFADDKNHAFANGYLDALYGFDVPKGVLQCCNFTYLFNMCQYCTDYICDGKFDKLERLIDFITQNYMKDGKLALEEHLLNVAKLEDFPNLKGFEFSLVKGSFSPYNLTFKCTLGGTKFFLKIMKTNEEGLQDCLSKYQLLQESGISISPVRGFGQCKDAGRVWVLFDFIDFPELAANAQTFEEGAQFGSAVAKQLKKLKKCPPQQLKTFDSNKLYEALMTSVDFVFEDKQHNQFVKWSKTEIVAFLNKFIVCFQQEPICPIHGDVKFGNILCDGKEKLVFVDNESLMNSFDIINFFHNILSGFSGKHVLLYQGFVSAYLKEMNGGKLPTRIAGQAKLLLLAKLLKDVEGIKRKTGSEKNIALLNSLCEIHLEKEEDIQWLR